jgi:hypothetical protein
MPRTQQLPLHRPRAAIIGDFAVERQLRGQPGVSTLYSVEGGDTVVLQLLRFLADRPASHRTLLDALDVRERLGCDGLVPVIATGHAREGSWIALDLPHGMTLRQLLSANGPLSLARSLAILRPVAAALDAGHAHGLVCDSLTADSIFVSGDPGSDERGQLIDLGPVWPSDVRPGRLLGDPTGIAPEEIRGAAPSPASNVYALAALLVGSLEAAPPFRAPTRAGMLCSHLESTPPRLSERLPDVPDAFDDVIASALAKDPRVRPASAGELIDRAARAATSSERSAPRLVLLPSAATGATPETAVPVAAPRTLAGRPAPNPNVMRVLRRVAVGVPAASLTLLAVIAALHADPIRRTPKAAQPATARQAPQNHAATAALTPVQDSGGRPAPSGRLEIAAEGGRRQLTVTAADLPPERGRPRQAYAVWLFNSRTDATRLGFVVPPVGTGGRFESHRELPAQARRYRQIVITLESAAQKRPQGPIFLRGDLPTAALTASVPGDVVR